MKYFLLMVLAASCVADEPDIIVKIRPAPTESRTSITTSGEDTKPLTDSEAIIFNLEKAVEAYTAAKPEDIFVKSPDNKADLYYKNNWNEVKRHFTLKHIKIVNISNEVVAQSVKEYANNETEKKTVTGVDYDGYSSFESRHYWSGEKVEARVRYELIRPAKTDLNYKYYSKVGQDSFGSGVTIITYVDTSAKFDLKPGQSAKFIVKAAEIKTNVLVEYETNLTGDVVANYSEKHKGKHLWAYDVNTVLSASNMSSVVKSQEFVTIEYLSGFAVQVVDLVTGEDIPFTDLSYYE